MSLALYHSGHMITLADGVTTTAHGGATFFQLKPHNKGRKMVFALTEYAYEGHPSEWVFHIYLSERHQRERPHSAIASGSLMGQTKAEALSDFERWRSRKPAYRRAVEKPRIPEPWETA